MKTKELFFLSAFSVVAPTMAFGQDQGCGTPPECYAKAAAMLNNATRQIGPLQEKVQKQQDEISTLTAAVHVLQQHVDGLQAETSVAKLRSRLYVKKIPDQQALLCSTYSDKRKVLPANVDPWPYAIISLECEQGEVRISGGCAFTCFRMEHAISVPTDANGWSCGVISDDNVRRFSPYVVCLKPN
jgi:hypothetical protein